MRYLFLVMMLCSSFAMRAQSKLGEMACVYITTPDLDSSLAFYEKLGFHKTAANSFPVSWAQCSDGSLVIMMRKDNQPYIGLTYYVNDIEKKVQELEADSIAFSQRPKAGDPVQRYFIKSPDGFNIMLVPNIGSFQQPRGITLLNMSPADFNKPDKFPNQQCGVFGEFCHPVADLEASLIFWKKMGFTVKEKIKQPYPLAILSDGLMIIGLHQTKNFNYPAITYFGLNTQERIRQLKEKGIQAIADMQGPKNVVLATWEKQHFFLFTLGM